MKKKKIALWVAGVATAYFTVNGIVGFHVLKKANITLQQFGWLVATYGPSKALDILWTTADQNSK